MNEIELFEHEVAGNISEIGNDASFLQLSTTWLFDAIKHGYAKNFSWLGRPVIQIPQDLYAIQEIIWKVKPDLVIETGIAHGGSLIMSASMLALLDYCEAVSEGRTIDPSQSKRRVVGIDIDIRRHNREAIEAHPLAHLIDMVQGSSIEPKIVGQVRDKAASHKKILVFLDSNHTHDHVLAELEAYAPLVSAGSYCVVWDTGIEGLPDGFVTDRPWGKGNNPKTAVFQFLARLENPGLTAADGMPLRFEIDKLIEHKLAVTASPDGFLKREL